MIPLIVTQAAQAANISAQLLLSICTVETGMHNVNAYHDKNGGSFGICQLNEKTAKGILPYADRLALQQEKFNLYVAALYLKQLNNKYNNITHTISAYNQGLAWMDNGVYRNQIYVDKVMKVMENL